MTTAPHHWKHQLACVELASVLWLWINERGHGMVLVAPTLALPDAPAQHAPLTPDVVWIHQERMEQVLDDERGTLCGVPDLVVEVVPPHPSNTGHPGPPVPTPETSTLLEQYEQHGVQEYWIVDRWEQQIEVYRLEAGVLELVQAYTHQDVLLSPLLPGFACPLAAMFR